MIVASDRIDEVRAQERRDIRQGITLTYQGVMALLRSPGEQYEKARFKLVPMLENAGFKLVRVEDAE